MKNNICSTVIECFLASDKHEPLSFLSAVHCLKCKNCRNLIKTLRTAENAARIEAKKSLFGIGAADDPVIVRIMAHIESAYGSKHEYPVHAISFTRWISAGCILIAAIVLFGLFSAAAGIRQMQLLLFFTIYIMKKYLCFSLFITGYCAFFVGSNLSFFIKKIRTIRPV